ncbi:MAG: SPOR domain-containing protein [Gammaproteobacteria bacterium]|nr:SPOR domain-containing protein [Gammaproteobacteria bacterium]
MAISSVIPCHRSSLLGLLFLAAAPVTLAGPGFIESSRVFATGTGADIEVAFNCKTQYLRHEPQGAGDHLRIYLDPTSICNGVSPLVASSRSVLRPLGSDQAQLADLEYDGDSAGGPVLTLTFTEPVTCTVDMSSVAFKLVVHVLPLATQTAPPEVRPTVEHRQVPRPRTAEPDYVINLASFRRVPTAADAARLQPTADQRVYYSEAEVNGSTWYRLRLGNFKTADAATSALAALQADFPGAWIDQLMADSAAIELVIDTQEMPGEPGGPVGDETRVDLLMADARKAMAAGDVSRAVQIYTKLLRLPEHSRLPEAQEYLALAREKNGQTAHAKAEYQRYLSLYPNSEGAARVSQRLAALLASGRRTGNPVGPGSTADSKPSSRPSNWRMQTFFSQYYRRDSNQQNNQDEIVSQSALYSDVNFDARRRGDRFDFSSRLSLGYRNDFLDEGVGSGNETRVSYAYADLADARTGLRGRIGRQSRNTGGVLGRFDGLNLGYQAGERVLVNAVFGKPAYSATDGIDSARTFYGASVNYGPILGDLEVGAFFIQQDIEGMEDRQAVGAEFRYFGTNQSIWGLIDYDTLYEELGSAFLQASWRFANRLTLHGSIDRRHSPFLSTGNALIGQPVTDFANLMEIYPEDEIRQLGMDRSPLSTTVTLGLSHSLTPKLQINADINQTSVDASPESGGVFATPETSYTYFATSLVASSLIKEGDVTIFGLRHSNSDTTNVFSLTLDSRFPFGRTWRVNPRLRVDRRESLADSGDEWLYTPGIRVQYRRGQRFRIELEAGKQFAQRESANADLDRESFFFNLGYQVFF